MVIRYGGYGNSNLVGSLGNDVLYGDANPNLNLPSIVQADWTTSLQQINDGLGGALSGAYWDFSEVGSRSILAQVYYGDVYIYERVNGSWVNRVIIEDNLVYRFGYASRVEFVEIGSQTFLFVNGGEGSSVFNVSSDLNLTNTQNWENLRSSGDTGPIDSASNSTGNIFVYAKAQGITTLRMSSSGVLSEVDTRYQGGFSNSGGEFVKVLSVGSGYVAITDVTTFGGETDLNAYFIDSRGRVENVVGVKDQNFASTYATTIDGRILVATASNYGLNIYEVQSTGFELLAKVTDQSQFDITAKTPIIFESGGQIYVQQNGVLFQILKDGNDVIAGRDGNDDLYGMGGNDTLLGELGDDRLFGGTESGDDRLDGGAGNDALYGGDGNDLMFGGLGNDRIDGGLGSDRANFTGTVAATVNLSVLTAQVTGYGTDTLAGIEHLSSGSGNDRLTGDALGNSLVSGAGNDTVDGGAGNDAIYGGDGNDLMFGGLGNDRIDGGLGSDRAYFIGTVAATVNLSVLTAQVTGYGTDTLAGIEHLSSGSGNDRLTGNALGNSLISGTGNDTVNGGAGNDVLYGGAGNDLLTGGAGNDRFSYAAQTEAGDRVSDFIAADDTFVFQTIGFNVFQAGSFSNLALGTLNAASFRTGSTNVAADGNDFFIFRTTDTTLWFDADGNGTQRSAILIADLQTGATMSALDVLLI